MSACRMVLAVLLFGCAAPADESDDLGSTAALQLTEELRIDAETADLVPLNTMLVRADGAFLLDQESEGRIKVLLPDGSTASIGRSGAGPGEFRSVARIGWLLDSIWAFDVQLNRISIFSPELEFSRTIEAITTLFTQTPGDSVDVGAYGALIDYVYPNGEVRVSVTRNPQRPAGSWLADLDSGYTAILRTTTEGEVRARIAIRPPEPCTLWVPIGEGRARFLRPFCRHVWGTDWGEYGGYAVAHILPDTDGEHRYHLTVADADGRVAFARSIAYEPHAVGEAEIDSVRQRFLTRNPGLPPQVLEEVLAEAEAEHPPLRGLLLGSDGSAWLEEHSLEPGHHWLILDAAGVSVGRVSVPANFRLMTAEMGTMWGLEADEDGLESIVRYRVR